MADPNRSRFRLQFLLGFLACAGLMGYALYSQYALGLEPCNLCIFQRVAMIALGVVFALGALAGPKAAWSRRLWAVLAVLMATVGGIVSGRHLWIQSLPADQVPSCGIPLKDMMTMAHMGATTYGKVIMKVFAGSGECAKISWTLLGLSMPGWVLICFLVLAAWAIFAGFRRRA
ncbi:MAG: disulfide bond formation protein B [Proteobacteria bacterium]|nr:disulfide bond formation protein B [Pseudomonadota bacterium]